MEAIQIVNRGLYFPSGRLDTRQETSMIVLHHTGGAPGEDPNAEEIDATHRRIGWAGIGYHYVIRRDGTIEAGRPAGTVGAHAEGANGTSVGIALCGNFCAEEPSAAQIESAAMLMAILAASFGLAPDAAHIVGHRDLSATACPGDALYGRKEELIGKAIWYLEQ
ncbi:MAG: N-acetylmuramoyl-L-alanine amidase [Schwartzia sp.]|nr:N-acetylmuramoyl-L-alanine amidase [Schwartzia sp. (in: firmicutes)]MBR1885376.1 N-acetylmuramoyl-L-alanine amidase [Schwartzia sp. (in: firmicutes)]